MEISSGGLNFDENDKFTKRIILSLMNTGFNTIGFLIPALILSKLLLQSIWNNKGTWDAEVRKDITKKFLKWNKKLLT